MRESKEKGKKKELTEGEKGKRKGRRKLIVKKGRKRNDERVR